MAGRVRVAIIGSGISGLATAYFLNRESLQLGLSLDVALLERADRLGGVIRTEKIGSFILEAGPESMAISNPDALELVEELGLAADLVYSNDRNRTVYVLDQGRLRPLPAGMAFLVPVNWRLFRSTPLLSWKGKVRAALEPFVTPSRGDLSVAAFLERRLGREFTRRVAGPLASAIYGGDIEQLSFQSCLPQFYRMEQEAGSLWKGLRRATGPDGYRRTSLATFRQGMSQLPERLAALCGASIHAGIGNLRLHPSRGSYRVRSLHFDGRFEVVIVCTAAPSAAKVVEPLSEEAARIFRQIPYGSITMVHLAYPRKEFSHPLNGFGFVVPQEEAAVLDACSWVSSKFDRRCPPDTVLLRCAVHRDRRPRLLNSKDDLTESVHREICRILAVDCAPIFTRVTQGRKVMPQMTLGHAGRLRAVEDVMEAYPGLFVAGAYYGGAGIPDCIAGARRTARRVLQFLRRARRQSKGAKDAKRGQRLNFSFSIAEDENEKFNL